MKPIVRMMLLAAALLGGSAAQAQLTIEITKGVEGALPIAVVPFATPAPAPENVAEVVAADLGRSGRFAPLSPQEFLDRPYDFSQVNFANWRALQVDYLVLGQVQPQGAGFTVQFQLVDVFQSNRLLSYTFDVQPQNLRKVAHQISDLVYERLTGEKGIFSTRIAYISAARQASAPPSPGQTGGITTNYTLAVADYDGYNPQVVLRSTAPIMSPAWSPDGSLLAYVTFEKRKAQIVAQNLYSGERFTVADYPGINGAPSWSPDGRRMAFTLSRDGNPEIYLYDLASRNLTRLTTNSAIDTEPSWSPDGSFIVFTSDRGGNPQLYLVGLDGGSPQRLTYEGDYNAAGTFADNGQYLAMVQRRGGRFHIAVMDTRTRQTRVLTEGGLDESPTFAPNSGIIMYASSRGGRGVLATVTVDGRVQQTLVSRDADVRDPAWAPYLR